MKTKMKMKTKKKEEEKKLLIVQRLLDAGRAQASCRTGFLSVAPGAALTMGPASVWVQCRAHKDQIGYSHRPMPC